MPRVALLGSAPSGHGNLNSSPPQSILRLDAPCVDINIARSNDFAGRQDVLIEVYTAAHGWTPLGKVEVTASSVDPFRRRVPLEDGVLYVCAVDAGASGLTGSVTVILDPSWARATDSGLLAVEQHDDQADPHTVYMSQAEADARYEPIGGGAGSGAVTDVSFEGSDAGTPGGGVFTFDVGPTAPSRIVLVDYDGAMLTRGATPGYTWDGNITVSVRPPGGVMPTDAAIMIIKQA